MATATITTKIANPAKKGKRKMAKRRNLSRAQIAAGFGGKRRQAAAKAARKRKHKAAAKSHRPRTRPNAPKKHRRQTNSASKAPKKKRRNRRTGSAKKAAAKKRKNTGALYALVNPARKKGKGMATPKKKNRRTNPAGKKRYVKHHNVRHHRRWKNPGTFGRPTDWLALGAGAVVGGVGATSLPQMVMGASNTGPMGYLGMAASTAVLAVAAHFLFQKNMMLTSGVIAGGTGALIKRIIGDYTPFGQYLNANAGASGLGDYLSNWNFATPQIIGGNGNTSLGTPGSIPVSVAGAGTGAGRALMNV